MVVDSSVLFFILKYSDKYNYLHYFELIFLKYCIL